MEKKKIGKKWREIRSAVTMMCVMAAMLSTATFAWFTLTSSPTVTGMQMTATSQSGLLVATENTTSAYKNAITLATESDNMKQLKPVTPHIEDENNQGFYTPKYTGGTVSGYDSVISTYDGYVAVYKFWMKTDSAETDNTTVNVGLIGGSYDQTDLGLTNDVPNSSGTVVTKTSTDANDDANGAYAVRIGLLPDGTDFEDMIIIEPNADGTFNNATTAGTSNGMDTIEAAFATDVAFNKSGAIDNDKSTADGSGNTSGTLFTASSTAKEITMYIWLEGTDPQCANQIMADELAAQIQFTIIE